MPIVCTVLKCPLLALVLFSGIANAQKLTVTLSDVLSDEGQLVVSIYNQKKYWLSDDPEEIFQLKTIALEGKVTDNTIQFSLEIPAGEYAMYLFQDKDNNSELKSNWIGIPKEPVGTSNNAKGRMGPPKFKDALFTVTAEQAHIQDINLANLD